MYECANIVIQTLTCPNYRIKVLPDLICSKEYNKGFICDIWVLLGLYSSFDKLDLNLAKLKNEVYIAKYVLSRDSSRNKQFGSKQLLNWYMHINLPKLIK